MKNKPSNKNQACLIFERCWPYLACFVISAFLYSYESTPYIQRMFESINNTVFLTAMLTSLSIIFGFLLTAFTSILQSASEPIKLLREYGRFKELVQYNKEAVICIFISVIMTSLFLLINDTSSNCIFNAFKSCWIISILLSTFLSYRFLYIFYKLI